MTADSQPLNIVLVLNAFPKLSESFIVRKFIGLLRRGYDIRIIALQEKAEDFAHFPELNDPEILRRITYLTPSRSNGRYKLTNLTQKGLFYLSQFKRLTRLGTFKDPGLKKALLNLELIARIEQIDPDIVHFEFGTLPLFFKKALPHIKPLKTMSFRGFDLYLSGLDQPDYYTPIWQHLDGYHFLGTYLRGIALPRGCPADKPYSLISPAIDPEIFMPGPPRQNEVLQIISVARLACQKGFHYGLLAVEQLKAAGIPFHYTIYGDGNEAEGLYFHIHDRDLSKQVTLAGAVPGSVVREALQKADIFLHCATLEGFCNAVMEAQSMAVPVVTSNAGGLMENVAHGESGFVVEKREPGQLAEALITLAKDPELRRRMGEAGRRRVIEHFNEADQIQAFIDFYQRVYAARRNA